MDGEVKIADRVGITIGGSGSTPYGAGGATFRLLTFDNERCQEIWHV